MLVPEDFDSITLVPNFLNISLKDEETFALADLKASFREILACDASGRIYHCDLNYTKTLKPYDAKRQAMIGSGHRLSIGRSLHLFLDSILSLQHCALLPDSFPLNQDEDEGGQQHEMETLVENMFSISLRDGEGSPHYLSISNLSDIRHRLPVTVIINSSQNRVAGEFLTFSYIDVLNAGKQDPKDEPDMKTFEIGCLRSGGKTDNKCRFKLAYVGPEANDHS